MTISIEAKITAGSDIEQSCREAIELAERIGVDVDFRFNGVLCIARSGADPDALKEAWEKEMDSDHKTKVAIAY